MRQISKQSKLIYKWLRRGKAQAFLTAAGFNKHQIKKIFTPGPMTGKMKEARRLLHKHYDPRTEEKALTAEEWEMVREESPLHRHGLFSQEGPTPVASTTFRWKDQNNGGVPNVEAQ